MENTKETLLSIRELNVDYETGSGRLKALRNLSLDVYKGEILGIVGESGCGKSTLISSITGLNDDNAVVSADNMMFLNEDLLTVNKNRMRQIRGDRISMIFQNAMSALNPVISIGKQMEDIQYRSKISKKEKLKKAAAMLDKVGIPDAYSRLKNYSHEFSGGMQQRIAIAMALLSKPDLLIADEPTTALDVTMEAQIIHLLSKLQKEIGCSVIFVSHHLGVVSELCHRVAVMYAGEVVEKGNVADIFQNPKHPYTKALFECDPSCVKEKTRELPTIEGEIPDLSNLPGGCIFQERCKHAEKKCSLEKPLKTADENNHEVKCHIYS